jgi:hypothetical protein
MQDKILLYKRGSCYDVACIFIDDLAKALHELGREAVVIDGRHADADKQLSSALQESIGCVFSFNAASIEIQSQTSEVLHFAAFIDNPVTFLDRLEIFVPRAILTSVDAAHVPLLNQWKAQGARENWRCDYLPHGGSVLEEPFLDEERLYDVMFAGTYRDPESLRSTWTHLDNQSLQLLDQLIEHASKRRDAPLKQVWDEVSSASLSELTRIITEVQLLPLAEIYLRNALRKECFTLLGEAGICVHLFGEGWEQHPLAQRHILHGSLNYRDLMRQMRKAKIVLNINPVFTRGSHERPLTAMLQKAAVITDHNPFYAQHFREEEHLYTYQLQTLHELPHLVQRLLKYPSQCRKMAEAAYQQALSEHTWQQRAQKMLEMIDVKNASIQNFLKEAL